MQFVVNNTTWNLIFVNPKSEYLRTSKGSYTLGVTDDNKKSVYIANNLPDYMTDKVLAHEITHVYAFEFEYYMPIEIEEIVADYISLFGRDIIVLTNDIMKNVIRSVA